MINLGVLDILLIVLLIVTYVYGLRRRARWLFYLTLAIVLLIELERLAPGVMASIGNAIHGIDAFNATLPHLEICPIITIAR